MHSPDTLSWICATAAPLGMVYADALRRIPQWLGGAISSKCSAAFSRRKPDAEPVAEPEPEPVVEFDEIAHAPRFSSNGDPQSLVDEMLAESRYALLLRPQLIGNLNEEQSERAHSALCEGMCLVPAGEVLVHRTNGVPESEADDADCPDIPLRVDGYYLDRFPITNAQYYQFVCRGGYEQMAIWDPEVWPAVLDFVDTTGHVGPRFWRNGRYPRGEDRHPVVGVSWYEASAYARWAGKRLPTDAEWIKAASWPVAIAGHPLLQRRYPWGEAVDRARANLWGSGPGRTTPVDEFPGGVSVGGVHQLIGNVWEWTADPLVIEDDVDEVPDEIRTKLKSLRGGAFDTYLDTQATCHFQSGDDVLARKHNVGFRCAISLCDLSKLVGGGESRSTEPAESSLVETDA